VAGSQADRVSAVGEGVFQLDKTEYSTPEGTALVVTIQRTDGGVLVNDVNVILAVDGMTEFDIPSAEATKLVTFPKGTNLTSKQVLIQTLNKEQFEDRSIQVTILSVDQGGLIGPRSTAPVTLLGSGTPRVFDVTPDSGGSFDTEGTVLTVTGENFIVAGAKITSSVFAVEFWLPFAGGPAFSVPGPAQGPSPDMQVLSPTVLQVRVPSFADLPGDYRLTAPNQLSATYDVRVTVQTSAAENWTSPLLPNSTADEFVHTSGPTVRQLSIKQGPPTGGTQLIISGTKFGGATNVDCMPLSAVTVDGLQPLSCKYLGPDQILVTTPPHTAGPAQVVVSNAAAPVACAPSCGSSPRVPDSLYTYQGAPIITAMSPNFGPQSGGTTVNISGSNFLLGMGEPGFTLQVLFGGNAAQFNAINDNLIVATAPPGTGVQQVKVINSTSGASDFRSEANYTYSSGPLINSIEPNHGPSTGGSDVVIRGTGFAPGAIVKFGEVQAFATVINAGEIRAVAPPGAGVVTISVNVNSTLSLPGAQAQFSYDGPTVTEVSPIAGPVAGGTAITIRGTNFTTSSVVHINNIISPAVFVDPTTLTTVTPPSTGPLAAHVRVTTGSGQSPESASAIFTYTNGPIVDVVNPNTGPTLGATIVVITGKNFSAPLTVSFGDIPATAFNVNSATQITVLSPPNGIAGPTDVRVTKGSDVSPVGPDTKFTYVSATPKITAVTPNSGSTFGGTEITLTGLGFSGAACPGSVKFGALQAQSCTLVNDTTLTTVAPPNVAGPTVVTVTTVNGTSEIVANFTYISPNGPGGGTTQPPPGQGGTTEYTLTSRWTLLTWTGMDNSSVSDAIRGTGVSGGSDLSARISAVYLWDPQTSTYKAYFTGAEGVPGANDFGTFKQGAVYWVAILGTGQVPWVVRVP
jgi:hypothetical protein